MTKFLVPLLAFTISAAAAQLSSPPPRNAAPPPPRPSAMPPAVSGVSAILPQLNQAVENARVDLAALRVDKWKADANTKRQEQANVEALQRNMTAALPAIAQEVQANPGSMAPAFKLYRNVNVLYDVISSVTEAAGAYGSKEEYRALATDATNLDNVRRTLADQVEAMAASKDTEVAQLELRARQAAAAAAAAPPKKVVIDDTETATKHAKKVVKKKKTTTASEQENPPK